MKPIFLLLCITGIFNANSANAQLSSEDEAILNKQLELYEVQFKELMGHRGTPYIVGRVNADKVKTSVAQYGSNLFDGPLPFAFLFYHFENNTLYHWLFTTHGNIVKAKVPVTVDSLINLENTIKFSMRIDNQLGTTSRAVGTYKNSEKKYRLLTPESRRIISSILLPPIIADSLVNKKHLMIMPVLNISTFPFSMLQPWKDDTYLIDRMSFSFAHNFKQFFGEITDGVFDYDEQTKGFAFVSPVICGNPSFTDKCTDQLPPLEGAEREAKAVANLLNSNAIIGRDAIKDSIVKQMTDASFIYLATHGWADAENPLDKSFIALYSPGGCGYLTPREIQKMEFTHHPIVTLSACQSGLGLIHEAGIIGLARSFLLAGSRTVTMSLWSVNDVETARLMTLYAEELKKPYLFFPAEHWRRAVLRYRKEASDDPLFWAAFQTFGVPFRLWKENKIKTP